MIERPTIFIVDDIPKNLGLLFDYLETLGYRVLISNSGEGALRAIPKVRPDLILLDVHMPGLNGYEMCEQLKQLEATRDIPVLFLSASHEIFDKVRAFKSGGVDYITKPFQVEEVSARVDTHLTLRRLRQALEQRNQQLEAALTQVKSLSGLLPICANCKKIRDDRGYWLQVEEYISHHSEADFSHGICPDCMVALYPEYQDDQDSSV